MCASQENLYLELGPLTSSKSHSTSRALSSNSQSSESLGSTVFKESFLFKYTAFQCKDTLLAWSHFLLLGFFSQSFCDSSTFTKGICSGDLSSFHRATISYYAGRFHGLFWLGQPGSRGTPPPSLGGSCPILPLFFIHFIWGGVFTLLRVIKHTPAFSGTRWNPIVRPLLKFSVIAFGSHVFLIATVALELCWIRTHREFRSSVKGSGQRGLGYKETRILIGTTECRNYRLPFLNPALEQRLDNVQISGTRNLGKAAGPHHPSNKRDWGYFLQNVCFLLKNSSSRLP